VTKVSKVSGYAVERVGSKVWKITGQHVSLYVEAVKRDLTSMVEAVDGLVKGGHAKALWKHTESQPITSEVVALFNSRHIENYELEQHYGLPVGRL
jgi:hypothetical protein